MMNYASPSPTHAGSVRAPFKTLISYIGKEIAYWGE